ncbi:MAG: glycosyltransferase family 4 protein [Nitrospinae bacterium]|nr:glycosyltransferase family 4 protein [Nitrospinota bacterium]
MKKNILYLINTPDIKGGGEISLLNLLNKLDKNLYNPVAVCPGEGLMSSEIKKIGINAEIIPMRQLRYLNIGSFIRGVWSIIGVINNYKIDLIHANGSRCMIYGGIAGRLKGIPVIWHVRIVEKDSVLDRFLSILSDRIIVISNSVKNRFNYLKNKHKISIVYNGVDVDDFDPDKISRDSVRSEFSITADEIIIGTISQFIQMKGLEFFIEAAKFVLEYIKSLPFQRGGLGWGNIRFLIVGKRVGDDAYERKLKGLVKDLGIENKVIFTGYRNDIKNVIASMDIFVLASMGEGFGRVLIEAMALKKPVVAAKSGGIPEIVSDGETGILVPERDSLEIASAVIRLIKERDLRERMGLAGRKRVEEMFTIERHAREIESQYSKILEKKLEHE